MKLRNQNSIPLYKGHLDNLLVQTFYAQSAQTPPSITFALRAENRQIYSFAQLIANHKASRIRP